MARSTCAFICAMQLADLAAGRVLAGLAAAFALLSFGPQKYVDPAFGEIWIAVIASQLAALSIFGLLIPARRQVRA